MGQRSGISRISRGPVCIIHGNPSEWVMPVVPSNPQDAQTAISILIAIAAYLLVAHWRVALRAILLVVIALAIYGAVAGIDGATPLIALHHR
jgi:hypothetical protein